MPKEIKGFIQTKKVGGSMSFSRADMKKKKNDEKVKETQESSSSNDSSTTEKDNSGKDGFFCGFQFEK